MKTILVPVDFSPASANALRYAGAIAQHSGASLLALHVVFPNEGLDNSIYSAFWVDDYVAQRQKDLATWVRRQRRGESGKSVEIRTECVVGFPVQGIADAAARHHADLIVLGATGATGLRGVFLGSVAAGVSGHVKVPVLIVPKKFAYWPGSKAAFATDFHWRVAPAQLNVLRQLLTLHQGNLQVVHILDQPGARADHSHEATFSAKLPAVALDFHYLHDRDVPQAISNFLESTDAGMLAIVAHEHGLLHRIFNESHTRRLAHLVRAPLLVLSDAKK